jgi:septum formation topological specificity factor MinE
MIENTAKRARDLGIVIPHEQAASVSEVVTMLRDDGFKVVPRHVKPEEAEEYCIHLYLSW